MNSDNSMQQSITLTEKQRTKDHNYLAPIPTHTKQTINFKAQSHYKSAELVEDDDEGEYEL